MNNKVLLALSLTLASGAALRADDKMTPKQIRMESLASVSFLDAFHQLTPQQKVIFRYILEMVNKFSDTMLANLSTALSSLASLLGNDDSAGLVVNYIKQTMQNAILSNAGDQKKVFALFRDQIQLLSTQIKQYFDTLPGMIVVEQAPVKKGIVERVTSSVKSVFTR